VRDIKLWKSAALLETILMAFLISQESRHLPLSDALWVVSTQLPAVIFVKLLLSGAPRLLFYVVTFIFQTVFFSAVFHLIKAVVKK
jgi:hypothetical protein